MTKTNAIVPVCREEVTVLDFNVLVAVNEEGRGFFSPRHVCQALNIDWKTQYRKIQADPVFSSVVAEMPTELQRADTGNKTTRFTMMIPIEFLSGWLFTIKKVAPETQDKLNRFRLEGFLALEAWFRQGVRNNAVVKEVVQVPLSYKEALYELIKKEEENERLAAENGRKDNELEIAKANSVAKHGSRNEVPQWKALSKEA